MKIWAWWVGAKRVAVRRAFAQQATLNCGSGMDRSTAVVGGGGEAVGEGLGRWVNRDSENWTCVVAIV